jgi:hypothetical protein
MGTYVVVVVVLLLLLVSVRCQHIRSRHLRDSSRALWTKQLVAAHAGPRGKGVGTDGFALGAGRGRTVFLSVHFGR